MILSLLLFVSSFFTTANRGKQKSHDYSRGVQDQEGRSSEVQTAFMVITFYLKKTFIPSKPLRSNACEKQKSHDCSCGVQDQEGRSSEVQTAFMVITFYLKKLLFQASHCEAMRVRNKKATIIVVVSKIKEERSSEVQTASATRDGIEFARTVVLVSALATLGSLLRKASHKFPL